MAQSARIDAVTFPASGGLQVEFTNGTSPLPPPSGTVELYTDRAALLAAIQDAETQMAQLLRFVALADWIKADPNMLSPEDANGKTATLDLLGAVSAISVG